MATDPGPYSALFDYKEEEKQLEQRKAQQEEAQKRIARTNALGDAFRLLADGIGGSRGASITPKPINPGIVRANERYQVLGKEKDAERLRLKGIDLSLREKDIAAGEADKDRAENQKYAADQAALGREHQTGMQDKTFGQQKELEDMRTKSAKELKGMDIAGDLNRQKLVNEGWQKRDEAKNARKGALASKGLFEVARYDDSSADTVISRNQVLSMLEELKGHLRAQGIYPGQMPRVLQMNEVKGKISDDDLKYLIGAYPDFFKPRLPELTGGTPSGGYAEPGSKDVFQIMFGNSLNQNAYNGPVPNGPPEPIQPQKIKIEPIMPDKSGNTDFSSYFN